MQVITVINCPDVDCVRKKLAVAKTFLYPGAWVHLDVSDGSFSPHVTWNDPKAWHSFESRLIPEIHLMVERPEELAEQWLIAGAERIIVHAETVAVETFHEVVQLAKEYHAEVMISSKVNFPIEGLLPYAKYTNEFQVLAVEPGPSGQTFSLAAADKVFAIREAFPNAIIEVDGGMHPQTARIAKDHGADTVVSSSYIFGSSDPKAAYETLIHI